MNCIPQIQRFLSRSILMMDSAWRHAKYFPCESCTFSGTCQTKTPQPINMKFCVNDYVGEVSLSFVLSVDNSHVPMPMQCVKVMKCASKRMLYLNVVQ
jgi:hypothetical protein